MQCQCGGEWRQAEWQQHGGRVVGIVCDGPCKGRRPVGGIVEDEDAGKFGAARVAVKGTE